EPVIVARQGDGSVGVLINRCMHRGATVCAQGRGHAGSFVCPYHGWTYDTDGRLRSVPVPSGYASDKTGELGLRRAPRVSTYRGIAIRQMRQNGMPGPVWEAIGLWTTARGHGYMGDYHDDSRLVAAMGNPVFQEYRARLAARQGEAEADRILGVTLWNSILYPNCSFMSQFRQLRIVQPLAVDRTVVYTYSLRMKDAPPQMFRDTVAFANVVNGTASWVLTDDLEVYERVQRGLSSGAAEWVYIARGAGRDIDEQDG